MVLLQDWLTRLQADDPEERQIISGVSWKQYEELLLEHSDTSTYRITYLDGILELMSPSRRHEDRKTNIGSLLEDYFKEKRIRKKSAFGTFQWGLPPCVIKPNEAGRSQMNPTALERIKSFRIS
ncbi:Uma2 family endonuclease [Myxacorys almedinensis]|uniref:Uma2 family endonuclease n=1 Tax=Myxacorys almedinensis TaxID=2651157 RepID=UPI002368DA71|nr:Uma2 family endonuclease [Myxacorys almedinensis]